MHVASPDDLPALKRLAETAPRHPIVALIEPGHTPSFVFEVNRQGAVQVVPLPLECADFSAAVRAIRTQFGGSAPGSQVIAVAGVTGGCGATAIAANLAYEVAHRRDGRCILAEPSLQLGKLANYFDVQPLLTTQDLFKNIDQLELARVEQVLTPIDDRFSIIAGPYRTIAGLAVTPEDIQRVLQLTRELASTIFLDVPSTLDDHFFQVLSAADKIVLIAEQKIPSLRSLQVVCDVLDEMQPARPRVVVVNRYNPSIPGMNIKKLEEVLKSTGFQTIGNDYLAMSATIDHGRPLRVEAPRSRVLADIIALAYVLFPELEPDVPGPNGGGPLLATLSRCLGIGKLTP
jgi:pilus assembly protein CpaE